MNQQFLDLARLYGIQASYVDMSKQRRMADPESLLFVLRALGAAVEGFQDVPDALSRRQEELRNRVVEPVMVAWDGELNGQRYQLGYHHVEVNGGKTFVISAPRKAYFPGQEEAREDGDPSPPLRGTLSQGERDLVEDNPLPPGEDGPKGRVRVAGLSPSRLWGLFVPIYALHSKRNPAAGDLTDFERIMRWIGDRGGNVTATLPLLAAFLDEPFEPSPYAPASRLFWNEFYIDVTRIPEFSGSAEAKQLAQQVPRRTKLVNYREAMAHKRLILEELARRFFSNAWPSRLYAFGKFVREHQGIEEYARFRSITDRLRTGWRSWPDRLRDGNILEDDYVQETKNYHLYAQWVIQEQLQSMSDLAAGLGQMLYLDLPLGLHPDAYDVWHDRQFFVTNVAGGAPPDPVFTKGQNWGFPPMHPEAMRLNQYQYFIAYIRNHLQYARLLRIDHVMSLHRLYWIPEGMTGDKGVYVDYPAEELYAILSLESHKHRAGIIGENLGTVPPVVNSAMTDHDIRQMYVVQYEIEGNSDKPALRPIPAKSVASLNTHDMPPFRAFFEGTDIDDRLELGFLDEKAANKERRRRAVVRKALEAWLEKKAYIRSSSGEGGAPAARRVRVTSGAKSDPHPALRPGLSRWERAFFALLQFLSDSMANIVLVNVEDLWGEVLPQNVPSTDKERPNWRRRIRPGVEQLCSSAELAKVLSDVFAHRSRSLPL